jgi:hypothetical protein
VDGGDRDRLGLLEVAGLAQQQLRVVGRPPVVHGCQRRPGLAEALPEREDPEVRVGPVLEGPVDLVDAVPGGGDVVQDRVRGHAAGALDPDLGGDVQRVGGARGGAAQVGLDRIRLPLDLALPL